MHLEHVLNNFDCNWHFSLKCILLAWMLICLPFKYRAKNSSDNLFEGKKRRRKNIVQNTFKHLIKFSINLLLLWAPILKLMPICFPFLYSIFITHFHQVNTNRENKQCAYKKKKNVIYNYSSLTWHWFVCNWMRYLIEFLNCMRRIVLPIEKTGFNVRCCRFNHHYS